MAKNNGGSAFPSDTENYGPQCGMSLRDYFAAKATRDDVQEMRFIHMDSHVGGVNAEDFKPLEWTEAKYMYADAMLAERAK